MPLACARSCSFFWNGVPRSFIACSSVGTVPGMMMIENSCALPTAYDIGNTAISSVPFCSASSWATGLMPSDWAG